MVQRFYDRLSKYSVAKSKGTNFIRPMLNRLSYFEISRIAKYLDHKEVMAFRRISRTCNYSACFGILENLEDF